jgi:lipopolysaccharide export system ATP-binding protein
MSSLNLKVDSVLLEFDGRKVLQDVHLSCTQGEIIGLLGRNGSGKSSLLKIIFGTLKAGYKYMSINDEYIRQGYLHNRIAYLPQHNYLPDNIKISTLTKVLVDAAFMAEFTQHPIYSKHHNKTAGQLSGGELRMLETLLVLYSKADFILLDEPFTHISPVQTEEFKSILKTCGKIKGIIITDHQYYNVLDMSDKIILLNNGIAKHINHVDELVTYQYLSGIK